ncbi:MAG TPA: hypothetical protein VG710_03615 [Opitutus sp.]|nr:hypothetical protein [Opitutus sp.]
MPADDSCAGGFLSPSTHGTGRPPSSNRLQSGMESCDVDTASTRQADSLRRAQSMKPHSAAALFVALLLLFAGIAWHASRSAERAIADRGALAERRLHLRQAMDRVDQRRTKAEIIRTRRQARLMAPAAVPPATARKIALPAPIPNFEEILRGHPELQNLQFAARRARFSVTYGPLYRMLGLTPAQIDQFEQNLLRREEQFSDLAASAHHQGIAISDPAMQKLARKAGQDYEAAQRALLGDSGERQVMEYDHTNPYREVASGLVETAAMAGAPLAAGQIEQLAQVLVASNPHRGTNLDFPDYIDWQLVHEQAKSFLSPEQLTFIETSEPSSGAHFLSALHAAVTQAAAEDARNQAAPPAPTQ